MVTGKIKKWYSMCIFRLLLLYVTCDNFHRILLDKKMKTPIFSVRRSNISCLIPLQIRFCTTSESLLCTKWKQKPLPKQFVQEISAWHGYFKTGVLFFLSIKCIKILYSKPTVKTTFLQFRCKIVFVHFQRVFFAQNE
jgi:hypothetical protein